MQLPNHYFTHKIYIKPEDIDALHHVNNIVYIRWIQDASAAHWFTLADIDMQDNFYWVVLRHEVNYLHAATLEDDLVAYTWVGEHRGARSERFVKICHAVTGMCYAESKTIWCLLSPKTMRPVKIDNATQEALNSKAT